jgi:hypothetical protein
MELKHTSIMGNLENCLAELRGIRAALLNPKNAANQAYWAIGGLMVTIMSEVMNIIKRVIMADKETATGQDARSDILEIQSQINAFLDRMLHHE